MVWTRRKSAPQRSMVRFIDPRPVFILLVMWQPFACQGTDYGVGGDGTWAIKPDPYYYQAWANGVQFAVGDTISFSYDPSTYDVRSLPSATALQNCNFDHSTTLGNTGNTVVPLKFATTYYFVSNGDGNGVYCTLGLHFQAIVRNATASSPSPPGKVPTLPPPTFATPAPPDQLDPALGIPPPASSSSKRFNVPAVVGSVSGVVGLSTLVTIAYCLRDFCCGWRKAGHQENQNQHGRPFHPQQSPQHYTGGHTPLVDFMNGMSQDQGPQIDISAALATRTVRL